MRCKQDRNNYGIEKNVELIQIYQYRRYGGTILKVFILIV